MDERPKQAEWELWLEAHAPRFLLFARQKTRSEADAQDLVQHALVEALQRWTEPGPPPGALVFATIHRRSIDLARTDHRRAERETSAGELAEELWFDTAVEQRERARLVQDGLSRLPEIYREVITLKIWGELTFAEIAESLDISANTAASRYRYGLQELRKVMKEVLI